MLKSENKHLLDISNLINNISDNSSLRELRFNILKLALPLFRASGASFFLSDKEQKKLDLPNGILCDLDSNCLAQYQQYYKTHDPFREVFYSSNLTCATDRIFSPQQWEKSMYCNEFLFPQKLGHQLVICVRSGNKLYAKISIFRQIDRSCFSYRDQEIALLMAKHLKYIIGNINLSKIYDEKINIYKELDKFPLMGIIVLDFNIKPIYYNEMAKEICQKIKKESAISNGSGQGNIPIPYEVSRDCQRLKLYSRSGEVVTPYFCTTNIYMELGKRYKFRCFLDTRTSYGRKVPSFIILIEDCTEAQRIEERTAMYKYKLTVRELEICNLVREGLTNKEISNKLFISLCTVETHLRNIFEKTEAHNRAELIKSLDCCLSGI